MTSNRSVKKELLASFLGMRTEQSRTHFPNVSQFMKPRSAMRQVRRLFLEAGNNTMDIGAQMLSKEPQEVLCLR